MYVIQSHLTRTCLALAAILTLGCGDSTAPAEPAIGEIEITVSTTGESVDIDPDGYQLWTGGGWYLVGVNETVTLSALPTGKYYLLLDGVATNCSVVGPNQRWVDVVAGESVQLVAYNVMCVPAPADGGCGWDCYYRTQIGPAIEVRHRER